MKAKLKNLMKPPADQRPLPKKYVTAKQTLDLDYDQALTALADYDGPLRGFLERILGAREVEQGISQSHVWSWANEASELLNVIYKVNGLKQRWATGEAPEDSEQRLITSVETVQRACNAAYKKGMIDTAQDLCEGCRTGRPGRRKGSLRYWHGTPEEPIPCMAHHVHDRIEAAGGWQAEWPKPAEGRREEP